MNDEVWEIFLFSPDNSPVDKMGCVKSRFEEMPVTGSPTGLKILPGSEKWGWLVIVSIHLFIIFRRCILIVEMIWKKRLFLPRFLFQEPMVLKLREKFFSFSGDDCRFLICNFSFAFYHFSYLQSAYFERVKEFCAVIFHTLVFCSVKDMDGRLWFR